MEPLEERIAELSQPLAPRPTGVDPQLPKIEGIRAVVFDIYGTLLISGSGDISLASEGSRGDAALEALKTITTKPHPSVSGDQIVELLHNAIHAAHANSSSEYPEVEIRDCWQVVLKQLGVSASDKQIEQLAIEYECRANPIWPMPDLAETLDGLRNLGLLLGVVSNAQFFTPMAFDPLTGETLTAWGFDPKLCVWSFVHSEAKPGAILYEIAAKALQLQGVTPEQTLFVGNDLRNDVWPAQQVGMRTALFAGDARSLRLREDDPKLTNVRPDAIVTDLRQLLEVV
jgi:putative hydrolase of the HAD superfamily